MFDFWILLIGDGFESLEVGFWNLMNFVIDGKFVVRFWLEGFIWEYVYWLYWVWLNFWLV